MKLFKTIAVGALALALAGVASATTVKVTGSTAFRAALYVSIVNQLATASGKSVSDVKVAWKGNANLTGAAQAVFSNGTDTVQTCLAGSVGGVNWVVNGTNVATVAPFDPTYATKVNSAWMDVSNLPGSGNVSSYNGTSITVVSPVETTSPAWEAASGADFTMSDSLQGSTPFTPAATGVTLVNAGAANLGVVQFVFAKGQNGAIDSSADARFTNMSALAFRNLAGVGYEQLSAFTGNATDDGTYVLLVGRDSDSGTRLGTAYETGLGDVTTSINQWKAFTSADVDVGPNGGTISYVSAITGQAGYASGGHVKSLLNAAVTGSIELEKGSGVTLPFIFVGYVGLSDVPTNGLNRILSYNGVVQSPASTQNGQYTFWTYEQAYYKSTLATAKKTIANGIATGVKNTYAPASGGLLLSGMKASRPSEGGVVIRTI